MHSLTDRMRRVALSALRRWGGTAQIQKTSEECIELAQAILDVRRNESTLQDFAEELADVTIMTEQIEIMVGETLVPPEKKEKARKRSVNSRAYKQDLADLLIKRSLMTALEVPRVACGRGRLTELCRLSRELRETVDEAALVWSDLYIEALEKKVARLEQRLAEERKVTEE